MPEFLQYDFMIRALLAGTIASVLVPLAGIFVVARRSSMISDTIAHLALIGVGLGILLNLSIVFTVVAVSVVAAMGIDWIIRKGNFPTEAIHSLFLSGGLATALLLLHFVDSPVDFEAFLFGDILTVKTSDIVLLALFSIPILLFYWFFWWKLTALAIHDQFAESMGINTAYLSMSFTASVALTIALSLRITGGLLIGALMVVPVLTASRLTKSLKQLLGASVGVGFLTVVSGLIFAFAFDVPAGSMIVLNNIFLFLCTYAASRKKL